MRRRSTALALTLLLAALAGCSLPADEPTVTPAPVPDAEVTTLTEDGPPVDTAAVENARSIAAAHREAIDNRTYRVRERFDWSRFGSDTANRIANRSATTLYGPDGRAVHDRSLREERFQFDPEVDWTNTSTYSDGDRRYIRRTTGNTTTYAIAPADTGTGRVRDNMTQTIAQLFAVQETNVTPTTVDGEPGYRLVGERAATGLYNTYGDYTVTALVESSGLVRRIETSYSRSSLGVTTRGSNVFVIDPVPNGTVTEPPWVETAREATDD